MVGMEGDQVKCVFKSSGNPCQASLIVETDDGQIDLTKLGVVSTVTIRLDAEQSRARVEFTTDFPGVNVTADVEPPPEFLNLAKVFGYKAFPRGLAFKGDPPQEDEL